MAAATGLILLIGACIGLGIYFAPSALAILRGNVFKGQVIKFQIIILVITIVVVGLVSVFGIVQAPAMAHRDEMMGAMVAVTEDASIAEPEMGSPVSSSASGLSIITILCLAGAGIWSLISIVLWFYILIHALRDQQMTLLSRFGINI